MILNMFRASVVVLMMLDGFHRIVGIAMVMHLAMHRRASHLQLMRHL